MGAGKIREKDTDKVLNNNLISSFSKEILLQKSKEELVELILALKKESEIEVPVSVFKNSAPPLESLVKYLKEEEKLEIKNISEKLNRNVQTIWTTYNNSKDKTVDFSDSKIKIPLSVFSKDDKSTLESLVFYLKTAHQMRFSMIAKLVDKDPRVIFTHYKRYVKKSERNNAKNVHKLGGK